MINAPHTNGRNNDSKNPKVEQQFRAERVYKVVSYAMHKDYDDRLKTHASYKHDICVFKLAKPCTQATSGIVVANCQEWRCRDGIMHGYPQLNQNESGYDTRVFGRQGNKLVPQVS